MKQSSPGTMGDPLTVLVLRKMRTFHFKAQWAWVLRARQGANHLHPALQALGRSCPHCLLPYRGLKASPCLLGPASSPAFAPLAHTGHEAAARGASIPRAPFLGSSTSRAQEGRVQCYVHFCVKNKNKALQCVASLPFLLSP